MHEHHEDASSKTHRSSGTSVGRLATSATVHCLTGCGLGEVAGDALGTGLNLSNLNTLLLGLLFGIIGGFALGIRPWLREGLSLPIAARRVLITEGLSVAIMEIAEGLVEWHTPGLMAATLTQPFYWAGMAAALAAGFAAAWPANYFLIRRGGGHVHH
jgi:Domain of unknown function (DUF4396)